MSSKGKADLVAPDRLGHEGHQSQMEAVSELEAYSQLVHDLLSGHGKAPSDAGNVILNRSPDHASVLIRHLIEISTTSVLVLSGNLHPPVYDHPQVLAAMTRAIGRGVHFRILLDFCPNLVVQSIQQVQEQSRFLDQLMAATRGGELNLGTASVRTVPRFVAAKYNYHFVVVDESAFRFESDRSNFEAIARSDQPDFGKTLCARFNEIWTLCTESTQSGG